MLGYLLLAVALGLYFSKSYRYISIFLYISFMLGYRGGFGLWNDMALGGKTVDLALVYTFAIDIFLLIKGETLFRPLRSISSLWLKWYKVLLVFFLCCAVFSFFHYHFTLFQILQGGRSYLLILSLPILIRVRPRELQRIMELCLWITVATSVLYILQIIIGKPLMPYASGYRNDSSTGLVRLYNAPAMLSFFLVTSFVCPRFFPGNVNIYRAIFFGALMCTLGRTTIMTTLFAVVLATVLIGKAKTFLKVIMLLGFLFLPFIDVISERFDKAGTQDDIGNILRGGATEYSSGDGTFTYRMAWIIERYEYLKDRPIGEKVFGLGLISESQNIVSQMYHFKLGTITEEGEIRQLGTSDTSYGNLLSNLGFVGMFIYLCFCVTLVVYLYRNRMKMPMVLICATQLIALFITSMSGSALSEPRNFAVFFLAIAMINYGDTKNRLLDRKSKWLITN